MTGTPALSVIMANRNGAPYVRDAVAGVLRQTFRDLELVFSDDGSSDDSVAVARAAANGDPRLRIVTSDVAGGPAAARNRALEAARGEAVAVVDSDDLMHPARFERMLARMDTLGVDILTDDQAYFGARLGHRLLDSLDFEAPWFVTAEDYLGAELRSSAIPVGYMKPVIRRSTLADLRYSEAMTVGEDFDLVFRLLLAGARMAVVPDVLYFYRRHSASISHRLRAQDSEAMLRATMGYAQQASGSLLPLIERRMRFHEEARDYAHLVEALKAFDVASATRAIARRPTHLWSLGRSVRERLARKKSEGAPDELPSITLVAEGREVQGDGFEPFAIPDDAEGWSPDGVAALLGRVGFGNARLRARGRAGLEALGYVPGWESVELAAPDDGWTEEERERIDAMPWPVRLV